MLVNAIYLRELVIQTTEIIYPFIYLHIRDQIHMIHFIYTHMHFYPYFMEELDDILVWLDVLFSAHDTSSNAPNVVTGLFNPGALTEALNER